MNMTADHENRILMGLAERADVVVDFTNVPLGRHILANVGPDEPFGGGVPGDDFGVADPGTTGQVMEFRVVPAVAADSTTSQFLGLPAITPLPAAVRTRPLGLIEGWDRRGSPARRSRPDRGGPWHDRSRPAGRAPMDPVTENPGVGETEIWELFNATADAHPMHVHEVTFEVVDREGLVMDGEEPEVPLTTNGTVTKPEPWETGFKDTVIAYRSGHPHQGRRSRHPASSSGIAISSSTRTTR